MTWQISGDPPLPTHHTNTVCAIACHPDGRQIATGDYDGLVIIRDRLSGEILSFEQHSSPISTLSWEKDALHIQCGNPLSRIDALHPSGKIFARAYGGAIRLYDMRSGRRIGRIRAHNGDVTALEFLPNGILVSAGEDEILAEWDIETGQCVSCRLSTGLMVTDGAISNDGKTVIAALRHGENYGLVLIDANNGRILDEPLAIDFAVTALCAHPQHSAVLYAADNGRVYRLSLREQSTSMTPYFSAFSTVISALAYSPDGNSVAAGIHGRLVVDPPGVGDSDSQQRVNDIAWHPHQPLIATSGRDSTVIIRNWSNNSVVHLSAKNSSPAGPLLWIQTGPDATSTIVSAHGTTLLLWEMATRHATEFHTPHSRRITALATSCTSNHFLSCDEGGEIAVWRKGNPHPIYHIRSHIGPITAAISHPSQPYFTTCGLDGRLITRLWESGDIAWERRPYLRVED